MSAHNNGSTLVPAIATTSKQLCVVLILLYIDVVGNQGMGEGRNPTNSYMPQ